MKKQITVSSYVVDIEREAILLVYHRKMQKWLSPGGHLEADEIPQEAAKREVLEETGLTIEFFYDEHLHVDRWNARSITRPFLCLLEEIPAFKDEPAHQHIDLIFVGYPVGGELQSNDSGINDLRWFTLAEIESLTPDDQIFAETQQVAKAVFAFCLAQKSAFRS